MKEIIRKNIAGIWSSIPTPFTENLELDCDLSHYSVDVAS